MSRPRVTITLGRSGQVVQRPASVADDTYSDRIPPMGRKRPVKERLGSNVDSMSNYARQGNLKRQRQDDRKWNYDHNSEEDEDAPQFSNGQVGMQDLRMKLLRKKSSRSFQSGNSSYNGVRDLREQLSGTLRSSSTTTNVSRRISSARNVETSRRMSSGRSIDISRRMQSSRAVDGLQHMSPPPRNVDASRRMSPPRTIDSSRRASPSRTLDASKNTSFMLKVNPAAKSIAASKPVVRSISAPGGTTNKHAYLGKELTVASLLHSLGLSKYSIIFQAEEVDITALKHMGDDDLKELGIPMGPRKKILLSLSSHSRH